MQVEKRDIPTHTNYKVSVEAPKKPINVAFNKDEEI
jgi:hypothetical protein